MNKIVKVLMDRDGLTEEMAEDMMKDAIDEFNLLSEDETAVIDTEEFLSEWFGLEPDYIFDFLSAVNRV